MSLRRLIQLMLLLVLGSASPIFAQTENAGIRHIQAAIILNGAAAPFLGTAMCRVNEECDVIFNAESRIKLSITLKRQQDGELGTMVVQCPEDCSFVSGRSRMGLQNQRSFEIFHGDNGVEIESVLKPRRKVGDVVLIVR